MNWRSQTAPRWTRNPPRNSLPDTKTTTETLNLAEVQEGQFFCGQPHTLTGRSAQQAAHQLHPAAGPHSQRIKLESTQLCRVQQQGGISASWAIGAWSMASSSPVCACNHNQAFIVKLKPAHIPVPRSWPQRSRTARLSFYACFWIERGENKPNPHFHQAIPCKKFIPTMKVGQYMNVFSIQFWRTRSVPEMLAEPPLPISAVWKCQPTFQSHRQYRNILLLPCSLHDK